MATMHRPTEKPVRGKTKQFSASADTVEDRRARRMAALRKVAGMWADRKDIPADGLEYQREMRAEWR